MKLCPKCQKQFSDDANFCPVDAARLSPLSAAVSGLDSQDAAVDPISARFELGDRLGGGRTGAVHRAIDKTTGQPAAVKLVAPAVVALPGLAPRLERELKQLERVQSAGVAKVLASGKRGDDSWVALELLDGPQTLAEAIAARGPIALDQAAQLIEVIGEALIEAAQVGVVHRDLAPKNILFAGAEVKLINFSLPVPTTEKVPGVPEFVAPEQYDGKLVDQRSNLYSLGALYYFVLTGHTIEVDEGGTIRPPSSLIADEAGAVPAPVDAVILRALDRSPTKRFLTVRQFIDEVGRIARGEVETRGTQPLGRAGKHRAELVQTLLGVRSGALIAPAGAAPAMPAMPAPLPPQALSPERSPWAPPPSVGPQGHGLAQVAQPEVSDPAVAAQLVAMPITTAPVAAAPVATAPVATAPVAAAPVVPPALLAAPILGPNGGKKPRPGTDSKGKFRDTMWFKKGELDAEAAEAAAKERAATGRTGGHDKSDSLPIDERYKDDGTLSRTDKEKYSLRTGGTVATSAVRDPGASASASVEKVSEDALIGEMKRGRNLTLVFIVIGLIVLALIVYLIAR